MRAMRAPATATNLVPRRNIQAIGLFVGLLAAGAASAGDPDCASSLFHNPEFEAGEAASAVALGDLNGDGDSDAVVVNRQDDNVSILLNNGDRTFAEQVTYPVGQNPWSVVLVDLDGDGDLDQAISQATFDDNVLVLFNDGQANFTAGGTYAAGDFAYQIVSGDLDGDQDPDLAVANPAGNTVSVLLNSGDGTFAAQNAFATGTDPRTLAIADLDGDADLDITTANWGMNNASVLLNDGRGSFGAPSNFSAGSNPLCIAAGDLDGDGDEDLAVGNYFGNDFAILINNGSAAFTKAGSYPAGTGRPMAAAVADLDDDGDLDIAAPSQNSETVAVLWNNGAASFATEIVDGASGNPTGIAVGDVDGDSYLDIAVANYFGYNVSFIFGRGDGTLASNPATITGPGPREVVLDDLDGDGDLDIAAATFTNNLQLGDHAISLHKGNGDGAFDDVVFKLCNTSSNGPQAIASGDLNGDGRPDLAIAYETGRSVSVMLNNGGGTFGQDVPYGHILPGGQVWANDVALGDLDGDKDLDLVSAGLHLSVSLNKGNGTFTNEVAYEPFLSTYSIQLEDVDGDDDLDIAAASFFGAFEDGLLTIRLNNGSGTFGAPTDYPAGLSPSSIAFGDIDGDGDREVLVANWFTSDSGQGHVSIMERNSSGDYVIASTVDADRRCRFGSLADLDQDGDLDIVVSNNVGDNVSVALNHGDGTFADAVQYGAGDGNWSHALGDVNHDGSLDIVTADYLNDTLSVLLNESADGDGDGTTNACDCAPSDGSAFALPSEIGNLGWLADGLTLAWDSDAVNSGTGTTYDLVRGDLAGLPVGNAAEVCLDADVGSTSSQDLATPSSGFGFYYLVRGENACGSGGYGTDSFGNPRTTTACP